jgi:hypothetical protein
MPNAFKNDSPVSESPPVGRVTDKRNPIVRTIESGSLGFWQGRRLQQAQRKAAVDVKMAETDAVKQESTALVIAQAKMIGQEMRSEAAREHAVVLAAISGELQKGHLAARTQLAGGRFAGTLLNIENREEMVRQAERFAKQYGLSQEDRERLILTAHLLHGEVEGSVDQLYVGLAKNGDEIFKLATASAKAIIEQN